MTPLERLRHAIALAHTVNGTDVRLHTSTDQDVVVSHHSAADIDPCRMRQIVAASVLPGRPDIAARVLSISIGGALEDVGGGVFATRVDGKQQRWLTSALRPGHMADVLDRVASDLVPEDAMSATIKPDAQLEVTIVQIASADPRWDHALDAVAEEAAAACFVEELRLDAVTAPVHEGNVSGGRS